MTAFDEVLDSASVIVACGPGGVGKTTTSAALGLAAARRGRRVVVVTVDPARRLADALGVTDLGNEPTQVRAEGTDGLHAVMLDAQTTFDRLVRLQAPTVAQAEAILANPMYRNIAGSLSGTQEYMAVEKLYELDQSEDFDLVIVDTPPSRNAIDLLEAPGRMVRFLEHPLYRLLTAPSRAGMKVLAGTARVFLRTVQRVAGGEVVDDAIAFFQAFAGMEDGFRDRAAQVDELLRADGTSFVVVSSPRAEAITESTHLAKELRARDLRIETVVVNMLHEQLPPVAVPDDVPDAVTGLAARHRQLARLADRERTEVRPLLAAAPGAALVEVPLLDDDVHDVETLGAVADALLADLGSLGGR
ncbi:MAG: ArsA-related P-loop ATPase [Actinomycetota bacterium]